MRTIKFRGKVAAECEGYAGQTVYGSLAIFAEKFFGSTHWINPPDDERGYPVEPDSVAQLIGVDKNGKDIYEGDLVELLEYNCLLPPTEATFYHYGGIIDGDIVLAEEQS